MIQTIVFYCQFDHDSVWYSSRLHDVYPRYSGRVASIRKDQHMANMNWLIWEAINCQDHNWVPLHVFSGNKLILGFLCLTESTYYSQCNPSLICHLCLCLYVFCAGNLSRKVTWLWMGSFPKESGKVKVLPVPGGKSSVVTPVAFGCHLPFAYLILDVS